MDLIRIGDKLVSKDKIRRSVAKVLERRAAGFSQQEVAAELGLDRTVISRLETMGEVRKGRRIALIGFPVQNKEELKSLAKEIGIDFVLLFSNTERYGYIESLSGADLFNWVLETIVRVRECDTVIFLGSDRRIEAMEALVGSERLVSVELGSSPLTADRYVQPERIRSILSAYRT